MTVAELAKYLPGSLLESTYILHGLISLFYNIFSVFTVKAQVKFVFFLISHGSYDPPHNELPPPLHYEQKKKTKSTSMHMIKLKILAI